MPRSSTPSFVTEIPLILASDDERHLTIRLDCARLVYNAVLGACLIRLGLLRQSKAFQRAVALPKRTLAQRHARAAAFHDLNAQFYLREYDLHAYAVQFSHAWPGEHLDANTLQTVATRAWNAVRHYQFGRRGKPRFKGKGRLHSVEGKTNKQGLRWRDGQVLWGERVFRARIDHDDPVIAHGLACPVKRVRIVRRMLNGTARFFVQLVCAGAPYQRPTQTLGTDVIGIDPGPRTFGIAGSDWGAQVDLGAPLRRSRREQRRLARKLDRQRRANNPANYQVDGRIKPGRKRWQTSRKQQATRRTLAECQRKEAGHRKSLHGRLANQVLRAGTDIRIEKNSYRSFQKTFGRAVGQAAPATFVAHLMRKAVSAGATVTVIPTTLRLSQTCLCGVLARKTLAERVHRCGCGITVQRDVFSAWLARFSQAKAGPDGLVWRLDGDQARGAWAGAESRLPTASSRLTVAQFVAWRAAESANGGSEGVIGLAPSGAGSEPIVGAVGTKRDEAADGVAARREPQKAPSVATRTPRL